MKFTLKIYLKFFIKRAKNIFENKNLSLCGRGYCQSIYVSASPFRTMEFCTHCSNFGGRPEVAISCVEPCFPL